MSKITSSPAKAGNLKGMKLKSHLLGVVVFAGAFWAHSGAFAAGCGDVTIASASWQSAELQAAVDKFILSEGYGCQASAVIGDMVATITSMSEKGRPDIFPSAAVDLFPNIAKRGLETKKILVGAKPIKDGSIQGWYIPKYVADANPHIKTIADALKHPELFPDPEDPKKGAIYNGPQGWGVTILTTQLYKAFNAEKAGFRLIDSGSGAGLDGSIAKAYARKQGWLGVYWSPTSLLAKYPMVKLSEGAPYNEVEWNRCTTVLGCPDPKVTGWKVQMPVTLIAKGFADRAGPDVLNYLNTRQYTNEDLQQVMLWMTENQANGEAGAKYFFKNKPSVWTKWVTPDAAAKIKAAL